MQSSSLVAAVAELYTLGGFELLRTLPGILAEAARRDLGGLWVVFAALAVSGLLLYYILRCLKSGRVWLYSKFYARYYYRDEEPVLFWVSISFYGGIVMLLIFGVIHWACHILYSGR